MTLRPLSKDVLRVVPVHPEPTPAVSDVSGVASEMSIDVPEGSVTLATRWLDAVLAPFWATC
jgi:hypothetical protein